MEFESSLDGGNVYDPFGRDASDSLLSSVRSDPARLTHPHDVDVRRPSRCAEVRWGGGDTGFPVDPLERRRTSCRDRDDNPGPGPSYYTRSKRETVFVPRIATVPRRSLLISVPTAGSRLRLLYDVHKVDPATSRPTVLPLRLPYPVDFPKTFSLQRGIRRGRPVCVSTGNGRWNEKGDPCPVLSSSSFLFGPILHRLYISGL